MTDFCAVLCQSIAAMASGLLGVPIEAAQVECPAQSNTGSPCGARCAAPLAFQADAALWAEILRRGAQTYTLLGEEYLRDISSNGGHLLFHFTEAFYSAMLRGALTELPKDFEIGSVNDDNGMLARISYTQRRMWMLSRKAEGEIRCPAQPEVQHALLLSAAVCGQGITMRARELRMLAASDALLRMTHGVLPRQRPALYTQCGYVGEAAARMLAYGLHLWRQQATQEK